MGDGRTHMVTDYPMVRTQNNLVHDVGLPPLGLACLGRIARSQAEPAYPPAHVTCFWCLTRRQDMNLRWFKWADEP